MPKCSYCNKEFERGSGKLVIQNTGKMLWFGSQKCETYMLGIGRDPKKLKWTRLPKTAAAAKPKV